MSRKYKLTIEYEGTHFYGWQKQKDFYSVQQAIEEAIHKFCGEKVEVYGAGRTDAGVHATAQVAHINIEKEWEIETIRKAVNFHLKDNIISILKIEPVNEDFHARFSARKRTYLYKIINRMPRLALDRNRAWLVRPILDIDIMQEEANKLIGKHDFTSFRAVACQSKSPVKTLDKIEITRFGENIEIFVEAPSFLHHQVRNIVGTLKLIGEGKMYNIEDILEAKDRRMAGPTAPAWGLYLTGVFY